MGERTHTKEEIPHVLFRVTLPSLFRVEKGFVQPHFSESEFGNSIPMIHKRDLVSIALIFGGEWIMKQHKDKSFLLLSFFTKMLQDIEPVHESSYLEYYAIAPTNSLISASLFTWRPRKEVEAAYYKGSLGQAAIYQGPYELQSNPA